MNQHIDLYYTVILLQRDGEGVVGRKIYEYPSERAQVARREKIGLKRR